MSKSSPVEILITVPFSESQIESLREISPRLQITPQPANRVVEISSKRWLQTEVLYTGQILPELSQVPNLRWIQFHQAGLEFLPQSPLVQNSDLIMTSLSGAISSKVAEFTVMMMLGLGLNFPNILNSQNNLEWPENKSERFSPPRELRGSTVGIVGYGSIGREIARLLQPFGVTILTTKRDAMNPKDPGYTPEGLGDPEGNFFHRLYPVQALRSMIKECDFIVISLPLTSGTQHLIGKDLLAVMKPSSFLINISRGSVVDESALILALQEHRIAGAALDVFSTEPLPPDSPFWQLPNVIISPHISGLSPYYNERAITLFSENIKRYLAGKPLLNRFDKQRGY